MKRQRLSAVALVGLLLAGCGSAVTGNGSTGGAGSSTPSTSTSAGAGATTGPADSTSSSTSSSVKPLIDFTKLTGNASSVVLSSEFISALTTLGIKPAVVGNTRVIGERLMLPVTDGNMTVYERGQVDPYVQGEIRHDGSGISLSAGGTTVELVNLTVRFGASSAVMGEAMVNGRSVGSAIQLFTLDLTTLTRPTISQAGVIGLSGTRILFSPTLAAALNDTFQTSVWKSGAVIGTLSSDLVGTP